MPVTDAFDDFSATLESPICNGFDISPNDTADLSQVTRAIMVGGAGDLAVQFKNGGIVTLPALSPGVVYPFRAARVLATGTTATGVKGLV